MNDLLDPRQYASVRLPLSEAEGLPPACYTDAAFYRREIDSVFLSSWIMVGRLERIPGPGDYFTVDYGGVELIVLRDAECGIRAYSNSCRHRGSRLLSGSSSGMDSNLPPRICFMCSLMRVMGFTITSDAAK